MGPALSSQSAILRQFRRVLERKRAKWGLHPLIHTLLDFDVAQDIESRKKRSRSSVACLKSEIKKKLPVLLIFDRRTKTLPSQAEHSE
jgi:hypothetical protein